jgi:hypothetical protein
MTIEYTNGTDTHRHRIHVLPFELDHYNNGGSRSSTDVDGHHNYAYTPFRTGVGFECGINDTFGAYMAKYALLIGTTWTAHLLSLHQVIADVATEVFPTPTPTPVAGLGTGADGVGQFRAFEVNYNFKSSNGGRGRITVMNPNAGNIEAVETVLSGSGGDGVRDYGLVAYVSGDPTGVVCHDGHKFQASCRKTTGFNRRLRRHYGFA